MILIIILESLKRVLVIILGVLSLNCYAQKGFYAGFSGNVGTSIVANQNLYGVKFQYLNKDKTFDPAHKLTIGYGGLAKIGYNFSPPIGLQFELGYQSRGQNYDDTDGQNVNHQKEIKLNYITTGVYFRYTSIFRKNFYKKEQKVRLALTIGPQFNVLVGASQQYSLYGDNFSTFNLDYENIDYPAPAPDLPFWTSPYNFTTEDDDKKLYKSLDVGILGRIGVDIYPKPWFFISPTITSYLSLTDINAEEYTTHSGYGASRNIAVGFEIGFGFYVNR